MGEPNFILVSWPANIKQSTRFPYKHNRLSDLTQAGNEITNHEITGSVENSSLDAVYQNQKGRNIKAAVFYVQIAIIQKNCKTRKNKPTCNRRFEKAEILFKLTSLFIALNSSPINISSWCIIQNSKIKYLIVKGRWKWLERKSATWYHFHTNRENKSTHRQRIKHI